LLNTIDLNNLFLIVKWKRHKSFLSSLVNLFRHGTCSTQYKKRSREDKVGKCHATSLKLILQTQKLHIAASPRIDFEKGRLTFEQFAKHLQIPQNQIWQYKRTFIACKRISKLHRLHLSYFWSISPINYEDFSSYVNNRWECSFLSNNLVKIDKRILDSHG
jgi:hypothetical protein